MENIVNVVKWLSFITFYMVCVSLANGQKQCREHVSNKGTKFLVTFPKPYGTINHHTYKMYVASSEDGKLNLTIHDSRLSRSQSHYDVHAGVLNIDLDTASLVQSTTGNQTKAVVIETDVDVAVFVTKYTVNFVTAASHLLIPVNVLSNEYVVSSFTPYAGTFNQNIVTALYNDTMVNITEPSGHTTSHTMGPLESYNFISHTDLSGAVVQSDKPVSVITGAECVFVPVGLRSCDSLVHSAIPAKYWGKEFIVPPLTPRSGYLVRIYTQADKQSVRLTFINSTGTHTGNFRGMTELLLGTDSTFVKANASVNVVQYGLSQGYDNDGDPMMTTVPAVNHYSNEFLFPSPLTSNGFVNRLVITMNKQYTGGLQLDGNSLSGTWTDLSHFPSPYDDYGTLTVDIGPGNHTLLHPSHDVRFAALLYGLKAHTAFAFSLGFTFTTDEYTCYNGGTCGQDKTCVCTTGYTGKQCQIAEIIESKNTSVCFKCEDAIGLSYCDSIDYCQQNEICFVQRSATNEGHVTFRSGCINKQTCAMHEQDSSGFPLSTCTHCCGGNLCNSAGCDDPGLPSRPSRGPLCLECSHVGNARDCREITLCSIDEDAQKLFPVSCMTWNGWFAKCCDTHQCSIEEFTWGEQRNFHLGCRNKHQCAFGSRSLSERSVPVCQHCCEGDLCNNNCTATLGPAIIG